VTLTLIFCLSTGSRGNFHKGNSFSIARVYEKKESGVLRSDIHSREEQTLEKFVGLFNGSMTTLQVMQHQELLVRDLNSLQVSQGELIKRIGVLADKVDKLAKVQEGK
jgi:hypothetical protein